MSIHTLEREILTCARRAFKNPKLRKKDILEWTTGECKTVTGEVVVKLAAPLPGISVAVAREHDRR